MSSREILSGVVTAFEFLTIFGRGRRVTPQQLGNCMRYFPVVGLVCGLFLYLLHELILVLPSGVVDVILLAFMAVYSRGLHLDGYCDTVDAVSGGRDKDHILEILRDSHTGALGVVGVVLLLLAKYACLTGMPSASKPAVL
ncbi:MAG: adenosylcobinamide-GDP ribazoletransferase, partial [Gemmatimonadales bacterium]|nr:adenosylcobinamide-GDP ribazoletransferase [Gemmatimonadales bacterium]